MSTCKKCNADKSLQQRQNEADVEMEDAEAGTTITDDTQPSPSPPFLDFLSHGWKFITRRIETFSLAMAMYAFYQHIRSMTTCDLWIGIRGDYYSFFL